MITRIVKLTFKEDNIQEFFAIFESSKDIILSQEGCCLVEMYQDIRDPRICFTYSIWQNTDCLNNYRKSKSFGTIWPKTKKLFFDKPEVWTVTKRS